MPSDTVKLVKVKSRGRQHMLAHVPSLMTEEEKRCCGCGSTDADNLKTCDQCRAVLYCSEQCANSEASQHKRFCYKYKHTKPADETKAIRVFYFPFDGPKPFIKFVGADTWSQDIVDQDLLQMTVENSDGGCFRLDINHISGRALPCHLNVVYRHWSHQGHREGDKNRSLLNSYVHQGQPRPRLPWEGGIVVVRCKKGTATAESVTMADLRDALDFFTWFGNQFLDPQMRPLLPLYPIQPPAPLVRGVVLPCNVIRQRGGLPSNTDSFMEVLVDALDPIRGLVLPSVGDVSPVSVACGLPVRMRKLARPHLSWGIGDWDFLPGDKHNPWAEVLMTHMREGDHPPGYIGNIHLKHYGDDACDVLVVREDNKDLSAFEVAAICQVTFQHLSTQGAVEISPEQFKAQVTVNSAGQPAPLHGSAMQLDIAEQMLPVLPHNTFRVLLAPEPAPAVDSCPAASRSRSTRRFRPDSGR